MSDFNELVESTRTEFIKRFGVAPVWYAAAPGRVNLIGEHTDYNDGLVLPIAIERCTVIAAAPSEGRRATLFSCNTNSSAEVLVEGEITPTEKVGWPSYVQGTIACSREGGVQVDPFLAVINSNIPLGGGLSSSAALEVATATLLEQMAAVRLDPVKKALICQKAEHLFAKMPCGIMDQMISVLGQEGHAMLLDCRTKTPKMIPMGNPAVSVMIINSNVKHKLTGSEYPTRRDQCEKAAQMLGVSFLRDTTLESLRAAKTKLTREFGSDVAFRRARHVITENLRTANMAEALAKSDWKACGKLMYASHDSLRDDFEVSCKELDLLVDIARQIGAEGGMIGSRMTGGGFGGCTVSLVKTDKIDTISQAIRKGYKSRSRPEPTIFVTRPAKGASIIRL